jgi:hypothetical protein
MTASPEHPKETSNYEAPCPDPHCPAAQLDLGVIGRLRGNAHRLGFALQLCCLRYLGFFPSNLYLLDALIIGYVGAQLSPGGSVLAHYARGKPTLYNHYNHQQQILTHPNYRRATPVDLLALEYWLLERASRNYQE